MPRVLVILIIFAMSSYSFDNYLNKSSWNNTPPKANIFPSELMPAKVRLCAMNMQYDSIKRYYIKGDSSNKFDHFVFQPINERSKKLKDEYTLIAYPYDRDGKLMTTAPIKLTADKKCKFNGPNELNLGNLNLTRGDLDSLYHDENKFGLHFEPYQFNPNYIGYEVTSNEGKLKSSSVKVKINPSPPA